MLNCRDCDLISHREIHIYQADMTVRHVLLGTKITVTEVNVKLIKIKCRYSAIVKPKIVLGEKFHAVEAKTFCVCR